MPGHDLLRALDTLHFSARAAHRVAWARALPEADRRLALSQLQGRAWSRALAMDLAGQWGMDEPVLAGLTDPSVQVRRRAASAALTVCRADALAQAVLRVDPATRRQVCRGVAKAGRADVAALLVGPLGAQGEWSLVRPMIGVLPWAHVLRLAQELGPERMPWERLALRRPEQVLAFHRAQMQATPHQVNRLWRRLEPCMAALAQRAGGALMDLLEAHPPSTSHGLQPGIGPLLRDHGPRVVALLTRIGGSIRWLQLGGQRRLHLRTLSDAQVTRLGLLAAGDEPALIQILNALPWHRRGAIFDAVAETVPGTVWSESVLGVLPFLQRHREAARRLALPAVQRDPQLSQRLCAWLPLDQAVAALVPEGRPKQRDGLERAQVWALWGAAVGRERAGLDALLDASRFLKNEQDPVRMGFLNGLAHVSMVGWSATQLDALEALTVAIVEARDTSHATLSKLVAVAHRCMLANAEQPEGPAFQLALRMLRHTAKRGQALRLPSLHKGLRRGAEGPIVHAVLDWLRQAVKRERSDTTVALATALGERAQQVPALQDLLQEIALTSRSGPAASAIRVWLAHAPDADRRVRALLDHDESAITLWQVWTHVAQRRQDWLDPFLTGRLLRGRWASKKAGWIPPQPTHCATWLPRQQRKLAALYFDYARDTGHSVGARASVLGRTGVLPTVSADDLRPWTRASTVMLAESALRALSDLDQPADGLPILLDNLDGDRARVAAYALPKLATLLPPLALQDALRQVLARDRLKVTVHKEAIRLLGAHRLPDAPALLQAQWRAPKVHRDVRLALLHAALRRLDEAWAWDLLRHAAVHPDPEVSKGLTAITAWATPVQHRRDLLHVVLRLQDHPHVDGRTALVQHLARDSGGLGPQDAAASARAAAGVLTGAVDETPEVEPALRALLAMGSLPGGLDHVVPAVQELVLRAGLEPDLPPTDTAPDLPMARRVETLTAQLALRVRFDRGRYRALADALVHALSADTWFPERSALATALLVPAQAASLSALAAACPHPALLPALAEHLDTAVQDTRRPWTVARVLQACDAVADWPELELAVVRGGVARFGWRPELLDRLGAIRAAHPALGRRVRVR